MKTRSSLSPLAVLPLILSVLFVPVAVLAQSPPQFLTMWGSTGSGTGQFRGPAAVTVDENGFVYVCESTNNRVQKFDADGNFILTWGSSGSTTGKFASPHGIYADGAGSIFVVDSGNYRVQKFTTQGVYVATIGAQGSANGLFNAPRGVVTDAAGNIYVADTFNHRIQKFNSSGAYLAKWGSNGTGNGQFREPSQIVLDADGNLFVSDQLNNRVQVFNTSGVFQYAFGTSGTGNGQFDTVIGLAVDAAGVYAVDPGNNRAQQFTKAGVYVTQWGSVGNAPGQFFVPRGMGRSAAGAIYVADTGNDRIQKFGPGPTPQGNTLIVGNGRGLPALGPISIPVSLSTLQTSSGIQFLMQDAPDWFHVTGVTLTGRATAMSVSYADGPAGLRVLVYSSTGSRIGIGTGEILRLTGTIGHSAVVGDSAALAVTSVLMAGADGGPAAIDSEDGVLYIARIRGDINGDNLLDAGDLVRLIEIVLATGDAPTAEELEAADCNGDNAVNLFDVTCLVDLILSGSPAPGPALSPLADALADVVIDARARVKAVQFTLPAGTSIEETGDLAPLIQHAGVNARGETIVIAFDTRGGSWTDGIRTPFRTGSFPAGFRAYGDGGRPLPVEINGEVVTIGAPLPPGLTILAGYPNPFRGQTKIRFAMDKSGPVRLSVFDVKGALVSRSAERMLQAGEHTWDWNPRNEAGVRLSAGVYTAVVEAQGQRVPLRLVLLGD